MWTWTNLFQNFKPKYQSMSCHQETNTLGFLSDRELENLSRKSISSYKHLLQYQPASVLCLRLHHIFKTILALFGRFGKDLLMFTDQDWTFLFLCGLSFYPSPCHSREIMIPISINRDSFTLLASFQLSGFKSFFLLFLRWETPQSEKQTRHLINSHKYSLCLATFYRHTMNLEHFSVSGVWALGLSRPEQLNFTLRFHLFEESQLYLLDCTILVVFIRLWRNHRVLDRCSGMLN